MAVKSAQSTVRYTGNNSATVAYVVPFKFFEIDHLVVQVVNRETGDIATLTPGVGYAAAGKGLDTGGTIVTVSPVPVTHDLLVTRNTPPVNLFEWSDAANWRGETLESNFDWAVMASIDAERRSQVLASRTLRLPEGVEVGDLPEDRSGLVVAFDEAGAPSLLSPASVLALSGGVAPNGQGVPPGGLKDELLARASSIPGAWKWVPPPTNDNVIPPGPYASDLIAYRAGVRFGQLYCDDNNGPQIRGRVPIGKGAFLGDSHTAFGSWKPSIFAPGTTGNSYWPWFVTLAGGAFELVPNPNTGSLAYALGGLRSNEFATLVSQVCASDADYVFVMVGTNDVLASYSAETTVSNIMDLICAPILEANKIPVVIAPYPMALTIPGNAGGLLSAKILQIRDGLKASCAEVRVPYYDPNPVIELEPGVGNAAMFADPTNVHLDPIGAVIFARQFLALLRLDLTFGFDPLSNTDWINSNATFATGGPTPTGYFRNASPPALLTDETIVTVGSDKWWELSFDPTGMVSTSAILGTNAANTESPAGLEVDAICLLEVISGSIVFGSFILQDNASATVVWALSDFNPKKARLLPSDGEVLIGSLTTATVAVGITSVRPLLSFSITEPTTVRVRLLTARKHP